MKSLYRKGVFIVAYAIEDDEIYYAILHRHKHWSGWEFPKGGVEEDEDEIEAVEREVKEETGLRTLEGTIKNYHLGGKYLYKRKFSDRVYEGQSYSLYSVEVKKGKLKVDKNEHSDGKWMRYKEALKKLTCVNQKQCLRIVDRSLRKEIGRELV